MKALKDMLGSKKAVAMVVGLIVSLGGRIGLELDSEALTVVLSPVLAYILGQGLADAGKEKARIETGSSEE